MLPRYIEKFYPIFMVVPEKLGSMDTLFPDFSYMYMLSTPPRCTIDRFFTARLILMAKFMDRTPQFPWLGIPCFFVKQGFLSCRN